MSVSQISGKITESHLNRKAVVYLRQSSPGQVRRNKESQRLQYALKDKAREWGWQKIEIIECDLGASASVGATERLGFEKLTGTVAMGEVGIIFNLEASRLSRTDKDWCRLLEVCGVFNTLISDGEQVYDSNLSDDQLILGIKATLSVYELKILRKRLIEGMQAKAARGEYRRQLPSGYIWDDLGKIVKDPDKRVQEAIRLVFRKFRQIQSIRQTFLWFHSQNIELPVIKDRNRGKELVWQLPKKGFIREILRNPCYAGVYVWGKNITQMSYENGKILKRKVSRGDARKAKVFIEHSHEGYIDMESYDEIQRMIRKNRLLDESTERVGPARRGHSLLAGILRCGRCGRKFYVAYYGKSGTAARYICRGDYESGGRYCLAFGGSTVDKRFSEELLRVISPYGIEAGVEAACMASQKDEETIKLIQKKIEQLEYEATRAFEQYDEVDPRNRLVASELEGRWNEKLEQLEEANSELARIEKAPSALTEQDLKKLDALGERFREVWESERCSVVLKKKIIRTVVEEVIVDLDEPRQMLKLVIHWKGGCHTELEMPKPPSGVGLKTSVQDLEIIRKMAARYADADIARVLNKLGRRTATGKRWSAFRVTTIRGKYSIAGHTQRVEDPDILSQGQAARHLGVSQTTIKRLVASGALNKEQAVPWAPWEIRRVELESEKIRRIVRALRETGRLIIEGVGSEEQNWLFPKR
jgi:DNA invertase Pin-like site-specific DNA recombinase